MYCVRVCTAKKKGAPILLLVEHFVHYSAYTGILKSSPLVFGVETPRWLRRVICGKGYRGDVEAAVFSNGDGAGSIRSGVAFTTRQTTPRVVTRRDEGGGAATPNSAVDEQHT